MKRQEKITEVSVYNAKSRQATMPQARIVDAVKALALLQSKQLQAEKGGSQKKLKALMEQGRD